MRLIAPSVRWLGGLNLVNIGAYWNNQGTDGLAFIMDEGPGGASRAALHDMAARIDQGLARYRLSGPAPSFLFRTLQNYAKIPLVEGERRVPPGHEIVAILNIAYLEEVGALAPDEYNGMQYLYEAH